MCDETGTWSTMVPAHPAATGNKTGKAGEVYYIQVEGIRRPAGLFLACHPFTLPERVRKKINHYANEFLRRLGRRL